MTRELIAFRLFPVGQFLCGEDAIIAHDLTWAAARKERPDLIVNSLLNMPRGPEYSRLAGIAYDMIDEAAAQGLTIPAQHFDVKRFSAMMERSTQERAQGQTSMFN